MPRISEGGEKSLEIVVIFGSKSRKFGSLWKRGSFNKLSKLL